MTSSSLAERPSIVLWGPRNSGKSSLINRLSRQDVSIVSDQAGTTTDLVRRALELRQVGAVTLVDSAGIDEDPEDCLGQERVARTRQALQAADCALLVLPAQDFQKGQDAPPPYWDQVLHYARLIPANCPQILVLNQSEGLSPEEQTDSRQRLARLLGPKLGQRPCLSVSALANSGIEALLGLLRQALDQHRREEAPRLITGGLVRAGDYVLLVMPQDRAAPKGRLIQAQSATIQELLQLGAQVLIADVQQIPQLRRELQTPIRLVICDSQVFGPASSVCQGLNLTSFSILFAAYKGDIHYYCASLPSLAQLQAGDRVLIAESCSHEPTNEDIGRVKIPRLLRQRFGDQLQIDIVGGRDFPEDLSPYRLIIQCGGCMFTRQHLLTRLEAARQQAVPMVNYGICLAWFQGILDQLIIPEVRPISD